MIQASGYEAAFLWFGLGQGIVVMVVALMLRAPQAGRGSWLRRSSRCRAKRARLRACRGAEVAAILADVRDVRHGRNRRSDGDGQLAPVARDFAIDTVPVSMLGLTMPALGFALSIGLVLNGVSRPFFGWVSDRIWP